MALKKSCKQLVADAQSVNVDEDGSLSITLTGSDGDGDDLSFLSGVARGLDGELDGLRAARAVYRVLQALGRAGRQFLG